MSEAWAEEERESHKPQARLKDYSRVRAGLLWPNGRLTRDLEASESREAVTASYPSLKPISPLPTA